MNKIEIQEWAHTCGDGCCYTYGIDVIVNGVTYRCESTEHEEVVAVTLKALGIEAEVSYNYKDKDEDDY